MRKIFFIFIYVIILLQVSSNINFAVEPDEIFENKKLELRARNISKKN